MHIKTLFAGMQIFCLSLTLLPHVLIQKICIFENQNSTNIIFWFLKSLCGCLYFYVFGLCNVAKFQVWFNPSLTDHCWCVVTISPVLTEDGWSDAVTRDNVVMSPLSLSASSPGHSISLIKIFIVKLTKLWFLSTYIISW